MVIIVGECNTYNNNIKPNDVIKEITTNSFISERFTLVDFVASFTLEIGDFDFVLFFCLFLDRFDEKWELTQFSRFPVGFIKANSNTFA